MITLGDCLITNAKKIGAGEKQIVWRAQEIDRKNLPSKWVGYVCIDGVFYNAYGWTNEQNSAPTRWMIDGVASNPSLKDIGLHFREMLASSLYGIRSDFSGGEF